MSFGPIKIHFHTDCYWFSGSEMTLLLLLESAFKDSALEPEFTYRAWPEYEAGLRARLGPDIVARPLRLPDPADVKLALTRGSPSVWARALRAIVTLLPIKAVCMAWDTARFYSLLRRRRPDILHINNGGFPGALSCNAAAIAGGLLNIPVVYVVNNMARPYDRPGRWLGYPVDRMVARSVSLFVTGSNAATRTLRGVLRTSPGRHAAIPNAVHPAAPVGVERTREQLRIPANARVVTVVAGLEARKGHRYLFEAFSRLPAALREGGILVVAGDGPERTMLERVASSLGIAEHVRFVGRHPDPWSLYELADVVVLPSVSDEDCPIVILEAMSMGRPVVATTIAGIPELVADRLTGRLVPPGDAAALSAALADLLGDPEGRAAMGKAAMARYTARYTSARVIADYRSAYVTLLHREAEAMGRAGPA